MNEIDINLCDEIEGLLKISRYISDEVAGDNSIRENIRYFVNNTSSMEDVKHIENIIKCIGNINRKLDDILDIAKILMTKQEEITEYNKTYLSRKFNKGDDLK